MALIATRMKRMIRIMSGILTTPSIWLGSLYINLNIMRIPQWNLSVIATKKQVPEVINSPK